MGFCFILQDGNTGVFKEIFEDYIVIASFKNKWIADLIYWY